MAEGKTNGSAAADQTVITVGVEKLDLHSSTVSDLQLARVVTRRAQALTYLGYNSDDDDSDEDESDGRLQHVFDYHDNGQLRHSKTFWPTKDANGNKYDRLVEEKHYDPDGVVRVDNHYAIGQPYLYRKHYWPTQQLKSESVFWVEDEVTMTCKKTGHWRTYFDTGQVKSEIQYRDGVRFGFCKRYNRNGAIEWVKDYTREYQQKIENFNEKKGQVDFSLGEAVKVLGLGSVPASMREVNSHYRAKCAPVHPDKTPDPDATEQFIRISRARDVLKDYFEKKGPKEGKTTK